MLYAICLAGIAKPRICQTVPYPNLLGASVFKKGGEIKPGCFYWLQQARLTANSLLVSSWYKLGETWCSLRFFHVLAKSYLNWQQVKQSPIFMQIRFFRFHWRRENTEKRRKKATRWFFRKTYFAFEMENDMTAEKAFLQQPKKYPPLIEKNQECDTAVKRFNENTKRDWLNYLPSSIGLTSALVVIYKCCLAKCFAWTSHRFCKATPGRRASVVSTAPIKASPLVARLKSDWVLEVGAWIASRSVWS